MALPRSSSSSSSSTSNRASAPDAEDLHSVPPDELVPIDDTRVADRHQVFVHACESFLARIHGSHEPSAVRNRTLDGATFSRWARKIDAESVAALAGAISLVLQRVLLDANVSPRRGASSRLPATFSQRARLESLSAVPYVEITPLAGSILAKENGTEAVRLHGGDFATHLATRCGLSRAEGECAWATFAESLRDFPDLLPDLEVTRAGDNNDVLNIRLRMEG